MSEPLPFIPARRTLTPRQRSVPVLSKKALEAILGPRYDDKPSFDLALVCLKQAGFEVFHRALSLSHSEVERRLADTSGYQRARPAPAPEESLSLWHPGGVAVRMRSYHRGGYKNDKGEDVPLVKELSEISALIQLETGAGREYSLLATSALAGGGSRSSSSVPDGTSRQFFSSTFQGNDAIWSFFDDLKRLQELGRFCLFPQWEDYTSSRLYFSKESLAPVLEQDLDQFKSPDDFTAWTLAKTQQTVQSLCASAPEVLRPLLGNSLENPTPLPKLKSMWWMPVEYAHEHVESILFLTNQRFPSPEVRQTLNHWFRTAARLTPLPPTVEPWEWETMLPGGITWPAVLLNTHDPKDSSEYVDRLLEILRRAPLETVRSWCEQPDAAGYTLPLLLMRRALHFSSAVDVEEEIKRATDILEVLMGRVGVPALRLDTERVSMLGLWLEFNHQSENGKVERIDTSTRALKIASGVAQVLLEKGCRWSNAVRYTTRPNTVAHPKAWPTFLDLGRGVDAFLAQAGPLPDALAVKQFLELHDRLEKEIQLNNALGAPASSPVSRPRM